jgi:cytochrome c oxidase subunit II
MDRPHLTTRRGFIAAMGFGGVSLYGLWAAYGAAPGPLTLLGLRGDHAGHDGSGPEGHGAGAGHGGHGTGVQGPTPEEFLHLTEEFVERYRLPDGSVHPRALGPPRHGDVHADHRQGTAADARPGGHGEAIPRGTVPAHDGRSIAPEGGEEDPAREVLIAAGQWYYRPHALRLDVGERYRFRMMAVDVSHGASIQLGRGGRIVRLRPGRLTEMEVVFHAPGRHLVYCTVYCGPAHDLMQATIEVA